MNGIDLLDTEVITINNLMVLLNLYKQHILILIILIILTMTKIIKLFLPNDFHEELLYQYEDKDKDLRKLVFGFLKPFGTQGKMVKLNQSIQARIMKDGKMTSEDVSLKDVNVEKFTVPSDPKWIPEAVTSDEVTEYTQSVSQRLYDDLWYYGKVYCARLQLYNDSLDKKSPTHDKDVAILPKCFEQIIQDSVVPQLSQSVVGNIDKEYDEEFEEMEKKIIDKKPPTRKK